MGGLEGVLGGEGLVGLGVCVVSWWKEEGGRRGRVEVWGGD